MPHPIGIHRRLFRKVREDLLLHTVTGLLFIATLLRFFLLQGRRGESMAMIGLACLFYAFVALLPDRIRWILRAPRFQAKGYASAFELGILDGIAYERSLKAGITGLKSKGLAILRIELFLPGKRSLLGPLASATPLIPARHFIYPESIVFYFEFEPKRLSESGVSAYPDLPNARQLEDYLARWVQAGRTPQPDEIPA